MPTVLLHNAGAPMRAVEIDLVSAAAGRAPRIPYQVPTTGAVYGALLNYRGALAALGDAINHEPYKAPPKAPVLYIKPANTWIGHGAAIGLPADVLEVEVGASLAVVIGRTATRVSRAEALGHVAGYTMANDISEPHTSYYRPALRQKSRDGFCPIGPWIVGAGAIGNPDALGVRAYVNGKLQQENNTANLIRSVAQLIADVTDYMTLRAGDVLLVGVPEGAPHAGVGDRVAIEIDGIGRLENPIVAEADLLEARA